MADERSTKPTFNFHSEATLRQRFKTPESREEAGQVLEQAAKLMKRISEDLGSGLDKIHQSDRAYDLEPKAKQADALKRAADAVHKRFNQKRDSIITARDNQLKKIERKQFLPDRRHAEGTV